MGPETRVTPQECTFYYQGQPVGQFKVLDVTLGENCECFWMDPFANDPDIVITDLNDIL